MNKGYEVTPKRVHRNWLIYSSTISLDKLLLNNLELEWDVSDSLFLDNLNFLYISILSLEKYINPSKGGVGIDKGVATDFKKGSTNSVIPFVHCSYFVWYLLVEELTVLECSSEDTEVSGWWFFWIFCLHVDEIVVFVSAGE